MQAAAVQHGPCRGGAPSQDEGDREGGCNSGPLHNADPGRLSDAYVSKLQPSNREKPSLIEKYPSTLQSVKAAVPFPVKSQAPTDQPSGFLLKVELRQVDGSSPPFPREVLSEVHPLYDIEAYHKREKDNFKRYYLRAVKRFHRRVKRATTLLPQQTVQPTPTTTPSPPNGATNDTAGSSFPPLSPAALVHTIRAEIRLVVRRALVANLRARRGKVKRAVFNSIVEETTDAVFVHWQQPGNADMPIRGFLSATAGQIHTAIDSHLNVMFATN